MWIRHCGSPLALLTGGSATDQGRRVDSGRPCRTLRLTHQKFPPRRSALHFLPFWPIWRRLGELLIHGSEGRLNQPVIGRSTARRSCPPPLPRVRKHHTQTGFVCPPAAAFRAPLVNLTSRRQTQTFSFSPPPPVCLFSPRLLCGCPPSVHP